MVIQAGAFLFENPSENFSLPCFLNVLFPVVNVFFSCSSSGSYRFLWIRRKMSAELTRLKRRLETDELHRQHWYWGNVSKEVIAKALEVSFQHVLYSFWKKFGATGCLWDKPLIFSIFYSSNTEKCNYKFLN